MQIIQPVYQSPIQNIQLPKGCASKNGIIYVEVALKLAVLKATLIVAAGFVVVDPLSSPNILGHECPSPCTENPSITAGEGTELEQL